MDSALAKIADDGLRRLATEEGPDAQSIIVEVDVPRARVQLRPRSDAGGFEVYGIAPETDEEKALAQEAIGAVRHLLEEIAIEPPVWLDASSSFAARVVPRRLAQVAQSRFVRTIHPNTLRR